MVMIPVMGITWIFGVVSVNQETMVFQFIFAILNSFQVTSLFIKNYVYYSYFYHSSGEIIHKEKEALISLVLNTMHYKLK